MAARRPSARPGGGSSAESIGAVQGVRGLGARRRSLGCSPARRRKLRAMHAGKELPQPKLHREIAADLLRVVGAAQVSIPKSGDAPRVLVLPVQRRWTQQKIIHQGARWGGAQPLRIVSVANG